AVTSKSRTSSSQPTETTKTTVQKSAGLHEAFIKAGVYLRNWSPRTAQTYRQGLHCLRIEIPTKAQLDAWVIGMRERGLTPGGVNMYVRTVNSYLTWLQEEGHTSERLRVRLLKAPLKVPTLLSVADIRAVHTDISPSSRELSSLGGHFISHR